MIGHTLVRGSDGIERQVAVYNSEMDVPVNWRQEVGGTNLAFMNPINLTTDPTLQRVGVDTSLIYDVYDNRSSLTASVPLRVVVPGISNVGIYSRPGMGNTIMAAPIEPIPLAINWTIVIVAIVVLAVSIVVGFTLYFILGGQTQAALAVTNGGLIETENSIDVDGDGINDIRNIKYNNGQWVAVPLTQAGADVLGGWTPITTVDPTYTPQDIEDIFNSGFGGFMSGLDETINTAMWALLILGGAYVAIKFILPEVKKFKGAT